MEEPSMLHTGLRITFVVSLCWLLGLAPSAVANPDTGYLIPELENFRPYIGKTYRGEFSGAEQTKPAIDISRWERALNGTAIRILHSINHGEYGGESIIFYDKTLNTLRFYYFTTAGFYTEGEARFDGNNFVSTERVTGNKDGITHVTSTAALNPSGELTVQSVYMKGEQRLSTSQARYRPVTDQQPMFQ
jgi:hypothetical protein